MLSILGDYVHVIVIVYIDDIVVYSRTWGQLVINLLKVLAKLAAANLQVSMKKMQLFKTKIEYLGFEITGTTVAPIKRKLLAISQVKRPKSLKEVRGFNAMCQFYRMSIPRLAVLLAPLYQLTRKGKTIADWDSVHDEAFEAVKKAVVKAIERVHVHEEDNVFVECDASDLGVAGSLFVIQPRPPHKPGYCVSRTIKKSEENYWPTEKEALAINYSLMKMKAYLSGRRFVVFTDHEPLTKMMCRKRKKDVGNDRVAA
jgi:hypothetical protein